MLERISNNKMTRKLSTQMKRTYSNKDATSKMMMSKMNSMKKHMADLQILMGGVDKSRQQAQKMSDTIDTVADKLTINNKRSEEAEKIRALNKVHKAVFVSENVFLPITNA
jgi:hypothetical protein